MVFKFNFDNEMEMGCLYMLWINAMVQFSQLYVVSSKPLARRTLPGEFQLCRHP